MADAKKQLEIADSDDAHDDHLAEAIEAAREQFEIDTPYVTVPQTFELLMDRFPVSSEVRLPLYPVTSIASIEYSDWDALRSLDLQTVRLGRQRKTLILNVGQQWPTIEEQPEAVVMTVTAGYPIGAVPKLIRQALKLQVAKWFEDRDMLISKPEEQFDQAYQRILRKLMRSSYP